MLYHLKWCFGMMVSTRNKYVTTAQDKLMSIASVEKSLAKFSSASALIFWSYRSQST